MASSSEDGVSHRYENTERKKHHGHSKSTSKKFNDSDSEPGRGRERKARKRHESSDESESEHERRRKKRKGGRDNSDSDSRRRRKRKHRRRDDSSDESEHERDSDSRRRRKRRSRRDDSESEDEHRRKYKGGSSSSDEDKPTEEELNDYLVKKAQRKAARVAKKLKAQTVSGYSNDNNPFGDTNLTERFVWRKKIEKDVATKKLDMKDISIKAEKQRQTERMREIEKVKKRREERAIEKLKHEEEMAMLARERAKAEFEDWEKKEEEFHFDQSRVRAQIRMKEGRAKPIDVISRNLKIEDKFDITIREPYKIFKGLSVKELEELHPDIRMHVELDRDPPFHVEFWEGMMVVCDWELSEARKRDAVERARLRGEEPDPQLLTEDLGLHSSVDPEVKTLLQNMSSAQLDEERRKIEDKMRSGSAKIVEFWECLLKRIHIFRAQARLREICADLIQQHSRRAAQSDIPVPPEREDGASGQRTKATDSDSTPEREAENSEGEFSQSLSPQLVHDYEGEETVDPEVDRAELERRRAQVLEEQQKRLQEAASLPVDEENIEQEKDIALHAMGNMEEGDAILGHGAEVNLESQHYWWHDKYRPRKPKYFNRVHTGYEWNKYNQTHYDHDNPPPKIVQGYKFNIFYPDLVDKTKAPTYAIEKDGNSSETCLIRFHAGPPYEDIAFRIVNKEWEYSHKKGFKCTFERGILHVYFNFKRYRYRR